MHLNAVVFRESRVIDSKTVGFFLKISKEISKACRAREAFLLART